MVAPRRDLPGRQSGRCYPEQDHGNEFFHGKAFILEALARMAIPIVLMGTWRLDSYNEVYPRNPPGAAFRLDFSPKTRARLRYNKQIESVWHGKKK